MQKLHSKIAELITDRLSLHELMQARRAFTFFADNFAQSYLTKILHFIQQKTAIQEAQGNEFDLILLKDGSVYSRGNNPLGALGLGNVTHAQHFTQITGLPRIKQIVASTNHAYYLSETGDVYVTGEDRFSLLTTLKHTKCFTPRKVPKLYNIANMSISKKTSFFVTIAGKVLGCGANDEGQVLPGQIGVIQELVEIPNLINARNVVASSMHTIVQGENDFYSFGLNSYGQLCLGNCLGIPKVHTFPLDFKPSKIRVTMDCTYILKDDGQLYICGKADKTFKKLTCIGPAKDYTEFNNLSKPTEIIVPHLRLIPEIETLSKNALEKVGRINCLPAELIKKLNEFSTVLISTSNAAAIKIINEDHHDSKKVIVM